MVKRGRSLTCKEIVRHPLQWWRIMLFAFLVVGPVWYALIDRELPYVRLSGVILPVDPEPGARIDVIWYIKPIRTCAPSTKNNVTRQITDSTGVVWGDFASPSHFGSWVKAEDAPDKLVNTIELPHGIARGPARYSSRACYTCDPFTLQRFLPVCVTAPDIRFNVGLGPRE